MVLEGILTTEAEDGSMHVAPMGPVVDDALRRMTLKPFQTSTSFANLRRSDRAVFHVVDDALLLARAVLGQSHNASATFDAELGFILQDATHWYALQIRRWDVASERALAEAEVVRQGVIRPFFGWNRAKHAVLEAAILVSRIGLLSHSVIQEELQRLASVVEKTAGPQEQAAFELLRAHLQRG